MNILRKFHRNGTCLICGNMITYRHIRVCPKCLNCILHISDMHVRTSLLCHAAESDSEKTDERIISLLPYAGMPKQMLNDYKFSDCKEFAALYAFLIYQFAVNELQSEGFCTVPVPCSLTRRRNFGWDQVYAVCRSMRTMYGIDTAVLLGRRRSSREQKKLSRIQRQDNAETYFCRSYMKKKELPSSQILLIDDVTTTGNTLRRCGALLETAYSRSITCIAVYAD